jgi:hypothetical protein
MPSLASRLVAFRVRRTFRPIVAAATKLKDILVSSDDVQIRAASGALLDQIGMPARAR